MKYLTSLFVQAILYISGVSAMTAQLTIGNTEILQPTSYTFVLTLSQTLTTTDKIVFELD